MPTDYLKMARECREEVATKEARIKEMRREYLRTGRADVRRRMALIEEIRDELRIKSRFYERRAEEYERKEKL